MDSGRAIAVKLAQEGVQRIAVHYLTRKNEAEKTSALLRDAGAEGVLVQGNTSNAVPKRSSGIRGGERAPGWPLPRFSLALSICLGPLSARALRVPPALSASPFLALRARTSRRSSLWTTKTRTPDLPEATSCTKVFGTCDFSRAEIPAGHSNQGSVALWR